MAQGILSSTQVSNAQVQELTKEIYDLFQNKTDVWGKIAKMPNDKVNALGIKVPIRKSPNPSLSYGTGNNDAFATPQASNLSSYTVSYVWLNAGLIESYMGYLNRNANTATDVVMDEEADSARQFASFLNCYVSRGNGTMALATVSVNYSGGTATIATCNGTTDSIGTTQLVTGGYYLFYDATGVTQRTGTVGAGAIQLASKTGTACTFGANIPSDVVATDIIVPQIGGSTDASAGLYGLPIIDSSTGTYYGATRSGTPGLASYEKTSAGSLTAGMLTETYFSTVQRGGWLNGDGTTNFDQSLWMLTNTGNLNAYYQLSLNSGAVVSSPYTLQHVGDKLPSPDIGLSSFNMTWFGCPIWIGNNINGGDIFFIGKNSLRRAVLKDVGNIADGFPAADFLQSVDGSGNWQSARIRYTDFIGNVYAPTPFTLGRISGLTLSNPTQKSTMVSN